MNQPVIFRILADLVLLCHVSYVAFVIAGLVLIFLGGVRGWRWVRNPKFRLIHLLTIGIVVLQAWLGILCPLTTLENSLRARAGEAEYPGGFIAHWMGELLFYEAPTWVFTLSYSLFGLLVLLSLVLVRPRSWRSSGTLHSE